MKKRIIETTNLKAEEGKIIVSYATHYDEELEKEVPDISGKDLYLPGIVSEDDFYEIDEDPIEYTSKELEEKLV